MTDKVTPIRARYEAGVSSDYNTKPPTAGSADGEIYAAGQALRDWARWLAKNSSIIKATLDARQAKGVGRGLTYVPMVRDRQGEPLDVLNDAIAAAHARWSERADVTGELARQEIERLAWRDWDCVGEVFGRKVYRGRTPQRAGYQVQLIRSELVPYGWVTSGEARLGIERDAWGAPTRYHVLPYSPASDTWRLTLPSLEPAPVAARDMVHLRRQEEMDATRGVTLFHAVIFRASDIAEYQESHRRAARASANLFASINRSADIAPDLAADPESVNSDTSRAELDLGELTLIDYLARGESVNFHAPQHPNVNATDFVNMELRQFAAATRCAFSWIAQTYDKAYAAQRTELVHAWELILEDRAQFVRDFCKPLLYDEVVRLLLLEGRLKARDLRRADPNTLYDCRIDGPVMASIDPEADRNTAVMDLDNQLDARHAVIRRFGRDPRQVDAEIARDPLRVSAPAPSDTDDPSDEGDANE